MSSIFKTQAARRRTRAGCVASLVQDGYIRQFVRSPEGSRPTIGVAARTQGAVSAGWPIPSGATRGCRARTVPVSSSRGIGWRVVLDRRGHEGARPGGRMTRAWARPVPKASARRRQSERQDEVPRIGRRCCTRSQPAHFRMGPSAPPVQSQARRQ
jgi:hypothetical protein